MANAVDSNSLVVPGKYDPFAALMQSLTTPAQRTTTNTSEASTSDTAALRSVIAQLQAGGTPQGSIDLINQIFSVGKQAGTPGINTTVAATGARAGSSSYQALATNDMNARLAGAAAVELNRNVQAAGTAASALAQVTQGKTQTQTQVANKATPSLGNILLPIGANVATTVLKDVFAKRAAKETAAKAAAVTAAFSPDVVGAGDLIPAASSVLGTFDPSSATAAIDQGGSMTDFISTSVMGGTPRITPYTATADGSFNLGSSSADAGVDAGVQLALNEFFGGGNNADTIGSAVTDEALSRIPGVGPVITAARLLGVNEINKPVAEISSVAGDVVQGAGDVVSEAWNTATKGTVICTELNRRKILSDALYAAYGKAYGSLNKTMLRGYLLWAKPCVRAMQKDTWFSKLLIAVATPFVLGRAAHITGQPNVAGLATIYIGEPVCYVIGSFCSSNAETTLGA